MQATVIRTTTIYDYGGLGSVHLAH